MLNLVLIIIIIICLNLLFFASIAVKYHIGCVVNCGSMSEEPSRMQEVVFLGKLHHLNHVVVSESSEAVP